MAQVLLVIHILIAIALVGVILLQKSEGGALGIGGGGGMSGFMTGRGTANLLTRTTAILAACFFLTSLALAWLVSGPRQPTSILDQPVPAGPTAPAPAPEPAAPTGTTGAPAAPESPAPAAPTPAPAAPAGGGAEPAQPAEPSVPTGQ